MGCNCKNKSTSRVSALPNNAKLIEKIMNNNVNKKIVGYSGDTQNNE